ncbi:MAG: LPS export ABC transporter periplasmic protein LptC [Bacteroidales bacterium]|nr:LPS export ABC transporter periplasmic protein LptC [Bacteroidales bacterium]
MKHYLLIILLLLSCVVSAQKKTTIHILNADKADYDERLGKDVQRLIGNVVMRQDSTYFYSDSAYLNEKTKFFDGFGNVHIIVNDSINIYSKLLKYNGKTKFAELFHDVVLKDDSTVLKTQYMTYDRVGHLATYPDKGTITRNDKKLVSKKGYYRDDIKVLYFRKDVVGTAPDYKIVSDTLVYDTENEMMYFYGPTNIYNKENTLIGNYGWYNTETEFVYLDRRATLKNKEQSMTADTMYYNKSTGYAKALSNVIVEDTSYKAILKGEYGEMWRNLGKCMMTDNLRAIYYEETDTLFAKADTMYVFFDTLNNEVKRIKAFYNVRFFRNDIQGKCDSMHYVVSDSMIYMREKPVIWADNSQLSGDSINVKIKKEAIENLLMYPNAFVIQEDSISGFNQVKGKQITAFFKENELNNMFNEGNAETIYWLRDDDGSLIGINFSQSSQMDIIIKNRQISNIKYYKNIKETLYPLEQLNDNQEFLDGFSWQEETRPRREEFDF